MELEQTCAPVAVGWFAIEQMDRLWLLQAVTHGREILKRLRQAGGLLPFIQHLLGWRRGRAGQTDKRGTVIDRPDCLFPEVVGGDARREV